MTTDKFYKVVKNEFYGWPEEWFPSISATIGDWYPSRNIFQIACAIASGPRFSILVFAHVLMSPPPHTGRSRLPVLILDAVGLVRTLAAGCWIYITSTDDHFVHDVGMIAYLVLTLIYMVGMVVESRRIASSWDPSPERKECAKWRTRFLLAFVASIPPLVWLFIRHKVHRLPGAYSYYAYCEWSIILIDVGFDAIAALDFRKVDLVMVTMAPAAGGKEAGNGRVNAGSPAGGNGGKRLVASRDLPSRQVLTRSTVRWNGVVTGTAASSMTKVAADVYLGFVFWTTWTSLPALVWYFPLWSMGLSGQEVAVLMYNSAFLLAIPPLRRLISQNLGACALLSLVGIGSYWILSPQSRLLYTGLGVAGVTLVWFAHFLGARRNGTRWEYSAWLLGLLLADAVKFACRSNNPAWTIMHPGTGGWNRLAVALGIAAAAEMFMRRGATANGTWKRDPKKTDGYASSDGDEVPTSPRLRVPEAAQAHWAFAALGLGGALFSLLAMATDSGTVARWAVEGYPHRGPGYLVGGVLSMMAMAGGLWTSTDPARRAEVLGRGPFAAATAGVFVLYFWHRWVGFLGGLLYLAWLFAAAPAVVEAAVAQKHVGRTFLVGTFTLNALILLAQWPVAYEFVPGGAYLRERTWLIVLWQQALMWCGLVAARRLPAEHAPSPRSAAAGAVGERAMLRGPLMAIGAIVAVAFAYRVLAAAPVKPLRPDDRLLTGGIWTIHFGIDNDAYSSHLRMEALIRDLEVDVFGILESDLQRIIMGNREVSQHLAERLGFHVDYGPSPIKHTWGCTLLSRFPILRSEHHLLPSPVGELACAIHATLDVHGREVDVIVSHNGQEENLRDRQLQTDRLAEIARDNGGRPIVFLGYVVTMPGPQHEIYRRLISDGNLTDIDDSDWDRWCEYVAYRGLKRVGYARVSHGGITDTEVQLGKFYVPRKDEDPAAWVGGERVLEHRVPEGWKFPQKFRGDGVREHRYHVFDEPRYFM
ncbi:calcofluor white hypersensitive protein [Hyaloraphidium curvatum]|nr:calcofluor white hypersensitive protein [Hyaloraphidium curvatum]